MAIKSLSGLVIFFLGVPYRLISFLTTYKAFLASLSAGVYFRTRVATGVVGRTWSIWVLLAVTAVREVDVRVYLRILNIYSKGLGATW